MSKKLATITVDHVETKNGLGEKGPWLKTTAIAVEDGKKYTTFDHEHGQTLGKGGVIELEYEDTVKGDFTYHNIVNIFSQKPDLHKALIPNGGAPKQNQYEKRDRYSVRQTSVKIASENAKTRAELDLYIAQTPEADIPPLILEDLRAIFKHLEIDPNKIYNWLIKEDTLEDFDA